jgi:predicted MFS family arabinose efflux permease
MVSLNAFAVGAEVSAGRGQALAIGIVNASVSVGQVVGYLAAGTLGAVVGWRLMSLEMLLLPAASLVLVLRVRDLSRRPSGTGRRPGPLAVLGALAHPRRLALAAMAALTLGTGQGATYLLPFAAQTRDLGPLAAAILLVPYVLGSVIVAPFSATLAERFGARRAIAGALVVGIGVCVALAWLGSSVVTLAIGNVLVGAAVNSTLPMVSVLAVRMPHGGQRIGTGAAFAGLRTGQSLGPFIGPTIAGAALTRGGPELAWLGLGGCFLLSLALHALISRQPS